MGRRWTKEEIQFLQQNHNIIKYEEIGKILGRTKSSVTVQITKLVLSKTVKRYTKKEISFIIDNYQTMEYQDIDKILMVVNDKDWLYDIYMGGVTHAKNYLSHEYVSNYVLKTLSDNHI